jgi:hypothetical protein
MISIMEIVDNTFILIVPRAIAAGLSDSLFWWESPRRPFPRFLGGARTRLRPRALIARSPARRGDALGVVHWIALGRYGDVVATAELRPVSRAVGERDERPATR